MKKMHLNLILMTFLFTLFLFNKKQNVSNILENELCSTKFDNIIVYHGPSNLTNKARIILRKGYPLYVLQRKKSWLKIIDKENKIGWIKKANISKEKRVLTKNKIILEEDGLILMPNVSLKLISIIHDQCIVEVKNKKIKINLEDVWLKPEKT